MTVFVVASSERAKQSPVPWIPTPSTRARDDDINKKNTTFLPQISPEVIFLLKNIAKSLILEYYLANIQFILLLC